MVLETEATVSAVWPSSSFYLAYRRAIQTPGEDGGQVCCARVLAEHAADQGRHPGLPQLHEDRVHELDQVPPPLHSLWVFTMGDGEGCDSVSSSVRAVQAGVLDMPLNTREQGWSVPLPGCWGTSSSHKGDVEAFLLTCPSLSTTRLELTISTLRFLHDKPQLDEIVRQCLVLSPVQFWLDCSTMPAVISAMQRVGDSVLVALFKITRNYCHRLHVARNKLIEE